jgi:AcrR family transcriptional regulator
MRADARENRERILDIARSAFASGDRPSMNQIAQRAGVGAGTLYRNYPSLESLAMAVYQQDVALLVDKAPTLLATHGPREALRRWTIELVAAMRTKHGLGDALGSGAHQAITEQSYGPVLGAITSLLDAGKLDGSFRGDVDPRDYLQFTGALWRAAEGRSVVMLDLLLDGLAA